MPTVDLVVESKIERTPRVKQLEAMFDVPPAKKSRLAWKGQVPIDDDDWQVGLIVGPSGSGKSTVKRELFGEEPAQEWGDAPVVDQFREDLTMGDISRICQAVGFNTIPAWMRPYGVLSTGERFRVELARRLLEQPDPVVVDEFTSVVDRQVAQIGSHAVQKYVRRNKRRFVAVTCHYDVIDWLQPDWVLEPATMTFARRSVQPRPRLDVSIRRVPYAFWQLFAPFHYLTARLNQQATCLVLFVGDRPAAFAGMLHRPHPKVRDIRGCSRLVTLPDWQGLGLAFVLIDTVAKLYRALGYRTRTYPAHPALVRSFQRSPHWAIKRKPGEFVGTSALSGNMHKTGWIQGRRPNAIFEWCGEAWHDRLEAKRVLAAPLG